MKTDPLRHFRQVRTVDFEFHQPDGERPAPICMVSREYRTGQVIRVWEDRLTMLSRPPFPVDSETLFVCYSAPAELSCFSFFVVTPLNGLAKSPPEIFSRNDAPGPPIRYAFMPI